MVMVMVVMVIVPAIAGHDDLPAVSIRLIPVARIEGVVVMMVMVVMMVLVLNQLDVGFR